MAKAFDLPLHSVMFRKMLDVNLSVIFVRLLILIYVNQVANVRWNGAVPPISPSNMAVVKARFWLL